MKAYVGTTALIFIALVVAHIARMYAEPSVARDPWFLLTTFIAVALAAWGILLYRQRDKGLGGSGGAA